MMQTEKMKAENRPQSSKKYIWVIAVVAIVCAVGVVWALIRNRVVQRPTVVIALQKNEGVRNFDTNYYTQYLEEKTGYDIRFEYIPEEFKREYLDAMLSLEEGRVDAVFFADNSALVSKANFETLVREGKVEELSPYVTKRSELKRVCETYENRLQSIGPEGVNGYFFFPSIDESRVNENSQILWMNLRWLKSLGLQVPQTTDELREVLEAFRDNDPNGNGLMDELPLVSNEAQSATRSYTFLMRSFPGKDPAEGIAYCNELYKDHLLRDECCAFDKKQMQELLSSPCDQVGAFTCKRIGDVIYPECADVLSGFIQVPPLKGPSQTCYALHEEADVNIGGWIPANAVHKREAFEIMDCMLSIDASCIAVFGEKNVDWRKAESGELSSYGENAKITTLHYLKEKLQNQNYAQTGPMYLPREYADSVAWNGEDSLVERLDARAVRVYEKYYKEREESLIPGENLYSYIFKKK